MDESGLVLNLVTSSGPGQKSQDASSQKGPKAQKTAKQTKTQVTHHEKPRTKYIPTTRPKQTSLPRGGESKGDLASGFSFNFGQTSSSKDKRGQQTSAGGQKGQTTQPSNNIISSLFRHNPEIPQVHVKPVTQTKEAVFSASQFQDLQLHPFMVSNLEKNLSVDQMTTIQKKAIPILLAGKDTLIKSQTGTGKTLAYAVPVVQHLQGLERKIQRLDGPYAVVLVPTRELALQSFETLQKLVKPFQWIVPGMLMGGEKKKSEKARLRRGMNILVSTPGRLVDHINTTKCLHFSRVRWVVLDEADRLLDMGFEKEVSSILNAINEQCTVDKQTVLASATLSEGVRRLASITLKDPVFVDGAKDSPAPTLLSPSSTPPDATTTPASSTTSSSPQAKQNSALKRSSGLEEKSVTDRSCHGDEVAETFTVPERLRQQFVIVPSKLRLVALTTLVASKCKGPSGSKMLVFLSSRESVDFHYTLFQGCLGCSTLQGDGTLSHREGLPLFKLHGSMSQQERTGMFQAFSSAKKGVLLCTDVAARGLDLPKVRWIIQYNTPGSPADYVHRVGRTARIGKEGHALLFLAPSEVDYVQVLEQQQISITEQAVDDILSGLMTSEVQDFIHGEFKGQMQRSVEEAATSLQLRFENHILNDAANTKLARRAFHSFIRAYATYPSSVKHIFHVRKLHLGHAAKSFGLREAPSDISNRIGGNNKRKGQGRSAHTKGTSISEFDSGLDDIASAVPAKKQRADAKKSRRKAKRRPQPNN